MADLNTLYYTKEHEWVKVKDGVAYIGITNYAQESLGDIVYVEMPEVGDEINVEDAFGVVESVKAASEVYSPVSGTVKEVNEGLEDAPELLNQAPFENFIVAIELSDKTELDELMNRDAYEAYLEEE